MWLLDLLLDCQSRLNVAIGIDVPRSIKSPPESVRSSIFSQPLGSLLPLEQCVLHLVIGRIHLNLFPLILIFNHYNSASEWEQYIQLLQENRFGIYQLEPPPAIMVPTSAIIHSGRLNTNMQILPSTGNQLPKTFAKEVYW